MVVERECSMMIRSLEDVRTPLFAPRPQRHDDATNIPQGGECLACEEILRANQLER